MKMKQKIGAALLAVAALTLTTSVPAEAVNLSRVGYCAWPLKATFNLYGASSGYGYSWRAYSPTGWYLGSHWGTNWATPWEDVTVFITTNDPSYSIGHYCR
jgi:hypothetical protein